MSLKQREEKKPEPVEIVPKESEAPVAPSKGEKIPSLKRWQWAALAIVLIVASLAIWRVYFYASPGKVASVVSRIKLDSSPEYYKSKLSLNIVSFIRKITIRLY